MNSSHEQIGESPTAIGRPRLLSIQQTIFELGIGRTTTYELIALGRLKTVKIGRRRFVTAEALDAFIASLQA